MTDSDHLAFGNRQLGCRADVREQGVEVWPTQGVAPATRSIGDDKERVEATGTELRRKVIVLPRSLSRVGVAVLVQHQARAL